MRRTRRRGKGGANRSGSAAAEDSPHATSSAFLLAWLPALGLLAACASAGSPPPPKAAEHAATSRTSLLFASGLRLIVDPEAPGSGLVGVMTMVDVGAGDDPMEKAGLAHLVEHLVFESTGPGKLRLATQIERWGGVGTNASTSLDLTELHALVPSAHAADLLRAEVDTLGRGLGDVDNASFERERNVVNAELARKTLPLTTTATLKAALFEPGHPMTRPVGGSPAGLARAQPDDARQFIAAHYLPRRITIYVTGDLGALTPEGLAREIPPAWRGHGVSPVTPQRHAPALGQPELPGSAAELAILPADIPSPQLVIAWAIPPETFPSTFLERYLTSVMSYVATSHFRGKEGWGIRSVQVSALLERRGSLLVATALLEPNAKPEHVASEMAKYFARLPGFMKGPTSLNAYAQWQTAMELAAHGDDPLERLVVQGRWAHEGGAESTETVVDIRVRDRALDILTSCLGEPRMRGVFLLPTDRHADGAEKEVAAVLPTATSLSTHVKAEEDDPGPPRRLPSRDEVLGTIVPFPSSRVVERKLSNGLALVTLPSPGAPLAFAEIAFRAAPTRPAEVVLSLAAEESAERALCHRQGDLWRHGEPFLPNRSVGLFETWERRRGGEVNLWPPRKTDSFEVERAEEARPKAELRRRFSAALWEGQVPGVRPTVDEISATPWPAIKAWQERVLAPENGAVVIVGDVVPDRVAAEAEQHLGGWHSSGDGAAPDVRPAAAPLGAPRALTLLEGHQDTRTETFGEWGCRVGELRSVHEQAAGLVATALLGRTLRRRLREELGTTYDVSAHLQIEMNGAAALSGDFDLHAPGRAARAVFLALFGGSRPLSLDADAVEQARGAVIRHWNLDMSRTSSIARLMLDQWRLGHPPSEWGSLGRALADVTNTEVKATLDACMKHGVLALAEGPGF